METLVNLDCLLHLIQKRQLLQAVCSADRPFALHSLTLESQCLNQ